MTLVGLGIDLVETSRIQDAWDKHGDRFLRRLFTEDELSYCLSMARPAVHLAARFAAKEAMSKAFGTGIGKPLGWLDVSVGRGPGGKPYAILSDKAQSLAAELGAREMLISLTHTEHYAAANAALVARV